MPGAEFDAGMDHELVDGHRVVVPPRDEQAGVTSSSTRPAQLVDAETDACGDVFERGRQSAAGGRDPLRDRRGEPLVNVGARGCGTA
jgi:hypothetical protein